MTRAAWIAAGLLALVALGGGAATAQNPAAAGFARFDPASVHWIDYPGDGGKLGVKEALLYGDPAKPGLYVVLIKWPRNVMSRPHSHPEDRFITVLDGVWWTGTNGDWNPARTTPMKAGSAMLHPHGEVHYDGARGEGALIQIVGVGPSKLINASPGTPDFARF